MGDTVEATEWIANNMENWDTAMMKIPWTTPAVMKPPLSLWFCSMANSLGSFTGQQQCRKLIKCLSKHIIYRYPSMLGEHSHQLRVCSTYFASPWSNPIQCKSRTVNPCFLKLVTFRFGWFWLTVDGCVVMDCMCLQRWKECRRNMSKQLWPNQWTFKAPLINYLYETNVLFRVTHPQRHTISSTASFGAAALLRLLSSTLFQAAAFREEPPQTIPVPNQHQTAVTLQPAGEHRGAFN